MLQIKTIYKQDHKEFDKEVNTALAGGWTLTRRDFDAFGFIAELEKVIITEAERCCDNCAHRDVPPDLEPCYLCSETCSEWAPES